MSVVACGVLVWVATRPDAPRPIQGYYEAARAWDADEAVEDASRQLGWTRPLRAAGRRPALSRACPARSTCTVADRDGKPVTGLTGHLFAIRPSDTRLNRDGELIGDARSTPAATARWCCVDEPGAWEFRIDTTQQALRFVHAARMDVPASTPAQRRAPSR